MTFVKVSKMTHMLKYFLVIFFISFFAVCFSISPSYAQQSTIKLPPTDDAFIVSNLNDPADRMGFQSLNTGNDTFIKIWYARNTTNIHESIISAGYLKFDLSGLKSEDVQKASLTMLPYSIKLTGTASDVDVAPVLNNTWTESTITFRNAPHLATAIASASISNPNTWYSWDITDFVKKNAGSNISLGLVFSKLKPNSEENIAFYSKEAQDNTNAPYLDIAYSGPPPTQGSTPDLMIPAIIGVVAVVAGAVVIILKKNRSLPKTRI